MANHALPTLESLWADFLSNIDDRLKDQSRLFSPDLTSVANQPVGTIRWNPSLSNWEIWDGTSYSPLTVKYGISISGNADTAEVLRVGRRINGTVFNGSKDITILAATEAQVSVSATEFGDLSGSTFDGSLPLTIGHGSVGAPRADGFGASGTWDIDISGKAPFANNADYLLFGIDPAVIATTKPAKTSDSTVATTAFVDRMRSLLSTAPKAAALVEDRGCLLHLVQSMTINPDVFAAGDVFVVYNNTDTSLTLIAGAGGTQRQAGTTLVGSRTLQPRALVTVTFASPSEWLLSGAGLT